MRAFANKFKEKLMLVLIYFKEVLVETGAIEQYILHLLRYFMNNHTPPLTSSACLTHISNKNIIISVRF